MVIDASAILAILFTEDEAQSFTLAIQNADRCRVSVASFLEAAIVIDNRRDAIASREFDLFFRRAEVVLEPITLEQAQTARQAYRDFGKGRHPAGLNFGDCFSYALAKAVDEPLLFKGTDFSQTDIQSAGTIQ